MTAGGAEFIDTNILVYAFTIDHRALTSQAIVDRGCVIGVQSLNEFTNVVRRKLRWTWPETHVALSSLRAICSSILPMDVEIHAGALHIAEFHGYSVFDSLLIAAALSAGCTTFWSEDLADGELIDGRLRVLNPFRVQ